MGVASAAALIKFLVYQRRARIDRRPLRQVEALGRNWALSEDTTQRFISVPEIVHHPFSQHPEEAALVGRMLVMFGELEFLSCNTAAKASGRRDDTIRALYRLMATRSRIDAADAFLRPACMKHGIEAAYGEAHEALLSCLAIRNRYAHCGWAGHHSGGMFYCDLQRAAESHSDFSLDWRHVDVALLTAQQTYFGFAQDHWLFIETQMDLFLGSRRVHVFAKPPRREPPPPPRIILQRLTYLRGWAMTRKTGI